VKKFTSLAAGLAVSATFCIVAPVSGPSTPARKSSSAATAHQFFVSPSASPSGDGSFSNPWQLQTALNQPGGVHPGDTIWLRGGTYAGIFEGRLTGSVAAPIIVRQYTGERAIIDGGNSGGQPILVGKGSYTWYWGFEIMSSDLTRFTTETGSSPLLIGRGEAVVVDQSSPHPGLKFINMIVHDARQGISFWKEAQDSEIYGCLIYYNGWEAPDRGHGHGIYTQNQTGTKRITDNILFSGFSHGIHAYGSASAYLDNIDMEGNTTFNAGNLSASGGRNLLLGGGSVAHNPIVRNNSMYRSAGGPDDFNLGYSGGCASATVTGNYVANGTEFVNCLPATATGNTFYGSISGFAESQYASNTYYSSRPTGVKIFVRPNTYEAGRANITVYNWDGLNFVNVDVSGVLSVGDRYEVRNAQDFFGAPVLSGTYSGAALTLPVTGLSIASPVGRAAPIASGTEFNAFVLLTTSEARQRPRLVPRGDRPPQNPER
jgi:hypothetical protein